MKIFNEQTNQLEEFKTIEKNTINMYVCGPTIYSDIHIGNARPIVFFDVIHRYWKKKGYNVKYVSNITDVDDKIINRAITEGISEMELVSRYYDAYIKVLGDMNIEPYYEQPRVTDYMDDIIAYIEKLVEKSMAYVVDGDVYFDVSKIENYGEISNAILDSLKPGARVDVNLSKKHDSDFVLWKQTDIGINWDSPWSKGRPGWHTECVVMIDTILGTPIDVHGGGVDLKFPHHENENAQACACGHNRLANYWMHNGFINIDSEKMSKSIGNVILAKDFISEYSGRILRLIMLQTNYRQPINLNQEFINQTTILDEKFAATFKKMQPGFLNTLEENPHVKIINEYMDNDFNIANVISYLSSIAKGEIDNDTSDAFHYAFSFLGLEYENESFEIPAAVQILIEQRQQAKQNRDFAQADSIRNEINSLGYEILDTRQGVECQKIKK